LAATIKKSESSEFVIAFMDLVVPSEVRFIRPVLLNGYF